MFLNDAELGLHLLARGYPTLAGAGSFARYRVERGIPYEEVAQTLGIPVPWLAHLVKIYGDQGGNTPAIPQ